MAVGAVALLALALFALVWTSSGLGGGGGDDLASPQILDMAASNFAKGVMAGADKDELVAQQLGAGSASEMSERAEELRREKEARAVKFSAGKLAYERGNYPASSRFLEQALDEEGEFTQLGGEIQLWLALAYQACGREEACLSIYRSLEKTHPLPAIRRQACDLRYIMEAPKLQINPDERVQIPVLTDLDVNRGNRAPVARPRPPQKRSVPKTWDEEFWDNYQGPGGVVQNRYVWAAASIAATAAAVYSSYVQRGLLR
ncbi:hypothetical protein CHLNCDRAFT_139563 [Chlorella variabilis]|uniref:Uncharacterized protein n=1 Tax=Chlorella variabilis TaxID=554065 RepID=E1ZQF1_CHLVA|nr:hypothetical protein CHLNCDRAFT_139563 [Chlorella variabilis]EFN52013.1 hypothetical protein CHLNCDRAFT_139563 [Chlorella variabilis]|eukprot:XP_005844115.1 hypothetical protein CHLNCDRAFT_139563 [Chlorella variabilis]